MNENIEHAKKIVAKKQETQDKVVAKEEKFDEYIQGLLDGREAQKEVIRRNEDDLSRMTVVLDRMVALGEEEETIRAELSRMVAMDPWNFGDPEEEKLESNPVYVELWERFSEIGREMTLSRAEVNKIYYRR